MGRSLEEMDLLFRESTSIRSVVRSSLKAPQKDDIYVSEALTDKEKAVAERIESIS